MAMMSVGQATLCSLSAKDADGIDTTFDPAVLVKMEAECTVGCRSGMMLRFDCF